MNGIYASPRGVGSNGGWASFVTGNHVDFGPDLSIFVSNRSDAYKIVDWATPFVPPEGYAESSKSRWKRVDRAMVDYRPTEATWIQVKLIVEKEHKEVLERLASALSLRDNYLDEKLIKWSLDPANNHSTAWAYRTIKHMQDKSKE